MICNAVLEIVARVCVWALWLSRWQVWLRVWSHLWRPNHRDPKR